MVVCGVILYGMRIRSKLCIITLSDTYTCIKSIGAVYNFTPNTQSPFTYKRRSVRRIKVLLALGPINLNSDGCKVVTLHA